MSDRDEFEKWYVNNFNRRPTGVGYETDICWQTWQAARAQSGRGAEPVAWWDGDTVDEETAFQFERDAIYKIPVYTHTNQPAKSWQDVEPVAFGIFYEGVLQEHAWNRDAAEAIALEDYTGFDGVTVEPIYTHPQPAQQGSVPEGWGYVVEVFLENVEEVTELLLSGGAADNIVALCNDLNKAATVAEKVLSTPQPEVWQGAEPENKQ